MKTRNLIPSIKIIGKTIVLFNLFLASNVHAQFKLIPKDVLEAVKEKKLLVALKNEIATQGKDSLTDDEVNFNTIYNKAIKEELSKYWKLTKGQIEYKTENEIRNMATPELKDYLLLHANWVVKVSRIQGEFVMFSFDLEYFEEDGSSESVFSLSYSPNDIVANADVIFMMKVLNNHIDMSQTLEDFTGYFNIERNIEDLKTKTLLLASNITNLSLDQVKKNYENEVRIVSPEEVAENISTENDEGVFIRLVWWGPEAVYGAFNTKDCDIVSIIGAGGLRVTLGSRQLEYYGPSGQSNFYSSATPYVNPWARNEHFSFQVFRSQYVLRKNHFKSILNEKWQKNNYRRVFGY
ncbi:hypothetical protein [Flagellimonas sp. CMM7]|uniref:hypothetical protein n=1 Tax=Flagellimonas sp. CMM7 TaxID=2654676 RepID=UPI0013D28D50|nr:hypothetical protein [Flagellimonas sp. CMM7]UII80118.1 hypothetical protein LV704_01025 [Flagellimonas sp. CMM7]